MVTKENVLKTFNDILKEHWSKRKLPIMVEVQEEIQLEDIQLIDILFGERNTVDFEKSFNQFTLVFLVNSREVKIDYLFDEYGEIENHKLYPNNLYKILNEKTHCEVSYYEEDNEKYKVNFELFQTLNYLNFKEICDFFESEFYDLRKQEETRVDKCFYDMYREYLPGVLSIEGTFSSKIILVFKSGLKVKVDKLEIETNVLKIC